jgi:hypothetical protein
MLGQRIKAKFTAMIGNDPVNSSVTLGCQTAETAARACHYLAKMGEIITVIGPRGGVTKWEVVGNGQVWKR